MANETASDEEIQTALQLSLEQLLNSKLVLVFSDLSGIDLDNVATQQGQQGRSDGSGLYAYTGRGFFNSTAVTAPSHVAFQAAQMKVLSDFFAELMDLLRSNGIDVDNLVVQFASDVKQDEATGDKSSVGDEPGVIVELDEDYNQDDDDDSDNDRESIALGTDDTRSGSSSVYIMIAATMTVAVGLIVLGVKRGFGRNEPEESATSIPTTRQNVQVVDDSPV